MALGHKPQSILRARDGGLGCGKPPFSPKWYGRRQPPFFLEVVPVPNGDQRAGLPGRSYDDVRRQPHESRWDVADRFSPSPHAPGSGWAAVRPACCALPRPALQSLLRVEAPGAFSVGPSQGPMRCAP